MSDIDIDHLRSWIGRTQEKTDTITPRLAESFNAIFDSSSGLEPGDQAPLGIHWCLAPDIAPMSELGPDGHPAHGGFLPPVPLPRRMWAGGQIDFSGDFRISDTVTRRSRIEDVTQKTGRSGALVFVTVRHDYLTPRGVVLSERQDIVYRDQATSSAVKPDGETGDQSIAKPAAADHSRHIDASAPLLFRYSALTFNGHRIHYDLPYATQEEHYPGLVFHGPLQASYLMRLATEAANGPLQTFSYRSVAPLFAGGTVSIHAKSLETGLDLWVADQQNLPTMKATTS
ncbi:MAG: FAS1-like dehydratase domain-containing protein [Hoeflea sp.]|uniref:FAS1-like dehydratase domain-containing protein n=1 Tax=Hoeflea sp. TaxID=1940281 RepID=UPI003EFA3C2E